MLIGVLRHFKSGDLPTGYPSPSYLPQQSAVHPLLAALGLASRHWQSLRWQERTLSWHKHESHCNSASPATAVGPRWPRGTVRIHTEQLETATATNHFRTPVTFQLQRVWFYLGSAVPVPLWPFAECTILAAQRATPEYHWRIFLPICGTPFWAIIQGCPHISVPVVVAVGQYACNCWLNMAKYG